MRVSHIQIESITDRSRGPRMTEKMTQHMHLGPPISKGAGRSRRQGRREGPAAAGGSDVRYMYAVPLNHYHAAHRGRDGRSS
jgi:hypothetical protein